MRISTAPAAAPVVHVEAPASAATSPKATASAIETRVVRVNGGDLVTRRSGTGAPALLLSGGPGVENYMDDVADLFKDDFSSIRYTPRGIMPAVQGGPYTVDQYMADALKVLDSYGIKKTWLIGHSWGGYLALRLAQEHPDRVAGVISIDGIGLTGDGGYGELKKNIVARMTDAERATARAMQNQITWTFGPPREAAFQEAVKNAWPTYFAKRSNVPAYVPGAVSSLVAEWGTRSTQLELLLGIPGRHAADISAPTLFIHGRKDPLPFSVAKENAAVVAGSKVALITDAGHYPWMEQPTAVLDAYRGWAATLKGARQQG